MLYLPRQDNAEEARLMWNESHLSLRAHPKTARLMRELSISRATAIGHLHALWWWVMEYAPDGDIARFDAVDVAIGAEWEGDPEAFLDGLRAARFLDGDMLHDWELYGGKLHQKRQRDTERKRESRGRPADIQRTARNVRATA